MSDLPDICGVWRLRSYLLRNLATGEDTEVFGSEPNGVLILLPEGRMAGIVTPSEQTPPVTEADRAAAFQKLIAYSGRYRLEPPNRFITSVDVAWYQPWLEKEQARSFALDGDMLEITSDPTTTPLTGDAPVIGLLSWRRETIAG
ncbi:MAG TPA: lipocalin-like domain-containing protein [Mycobacterium sp.]|nr:lipocalin-like domain-containing protein [Mycobacterium sp.]